MAGCRREMTTRVGFSVRFSALLLVLTAAFGCAAREPCFQVIAVTPASGEAMVFDACKGRFVVIPTPPPPAKRKDGGAA